MKSSRARIAKRCSSTSWRKRAISNAVSEDEHDFAGSSTIRCPEHATRIVLVHRRPCNTDHLSAIGRQRTLEAWGTRVAMLSNFSPPLTPVGCLDPQGNRMGAVAHAFIGCRRSRQQQVENADRVSKRGAPPSSACTRSSSGVHCPVSSSQTGENKATFFIGTDRRQRQSLNRGGNLDRAEQCL